MSKPTIIKRIQLPGSFADAANEQVSRKHLKSGRLSRHLIKNLAAGHMGAP